MHQSIESFFASVALQPANPNQGLFESQLQEYLIIFWNRFFDEGNLHYLYFWQTESEFIVGLDDSAQQRLYGEAQKRYKEVHRKCYNYRDYFIPVVFSPQSWSNHTHFYIRSGDDLRQIEQEWGTIAQVFEDSFLAFQIARAFEFFPRISFYSETDESSWALERLRYWTRMYNQYDPSEPLGPLLTRIYD